MPSEMSPELARFVQRNRWREHHYVFAHRLVPAIFYLNPARFLQVLAARGEHFLRLLWKLARGRGIRAFVSQVSAKGLQHEILKLDEETTAALIVLPPPKRMAEAYFVAPVYRPRTRDGLPTRGGALVRYVTLEWGIQVDLSPRTVLCEWVTSDKWQSDIQHVNHGDGPEPTPSAFLEAIRSLIEDRSIRYEKAHAVTDLRSIVEELKK